MTNGDGVLVKVDGIPFQTDCFTPAQTVERTEQNWQFKFASFCSLEKSVDLIGIIEAADVAVFFRTLNLTVVLIRMESFLQIIFLGPEAVDLNIRSCILLRKNQLKFPRVDG